MLKKNSPYAVIIAGYLGLITAGTILFMLPAAKSSGRPGDLVTSVFTATSAICVTGLTVVDTGTYFSSFGHLALLFLFQVGGLGYMVMTTFYILASGRKMSMLSKIAVRETMSFSAFSGLINFIKIVVSTTLTVEVIGAGLLFNVFRREYGLVKSAWYAIFHSVSAFCNAGFSMFSDSFIRYRADIVFNITVMALIILGGLGFIVLIELFTLKSEKKLSVHAKIVLSVTGFLLFAGALIFFLLEYGNPATLGVMTLREKVMASFFQSVTPRTAGFNTVDIGLAGNAAIFLIISLMFVGASPGGTGGGIKTVTAFIIIRYVWKLLRRDKNLNVLKRQVPDVTVDRALLFFFCALISLAVILFFVLAAERLPFREVFFEVVSAFGTVGLSTGVTAGLSVSSKMLLCLLMLIGRVGPLTLAYALVMEKKYANFQYPEEDVHIG